MKSRFLISTFILLWTLTGWSYELPWDYDPKDSPFNVTTNSDGTYNFYFREFPDIKIYQSKKYNLMGADQIGCIDIVDTALFMYKDAPQALLYDMVFLNTQTKEVSPAYPMANCMSPYHYNVMATGVGKWGMDAVIIQPIFRSQPKVWLLIKRKMNDEFPSDDKFLDNGNFYLIIEVTEVGMRDWKPTQTEIIPIDYSIFQQKVTKPTCYAMPPNHKLRLCTPEEAKMRSPSLKIFLGETAK